MIMAALDLPDATDHEALSTLFERYETLCRYCEDFFKRVLDEFPTQMRCAKGCASCCLLETVAPLEAYIIASYLSQQPNAVKRENRKHCVFLEQDTCLIYTVRPIICRTHGVPMQYPHQQEYDVCPLNFPETDLQTLDGQYVLDAELITNNFMRLNLAFCMLTQSADTAEERISLADILHGKYHLDREKSSGAYYPA
jgi:Fe-S-cluster containining protein